MYIYFSFDKIVTQIQIFGLRYGENAFGKKGVIGDDSTGVFGVDSDVIISKKVYTWFPRTMVEVYFCQ